VGFLGWTVLAVTCLHPGVMKRKNKNPTLTGFCVGRYG